MSTERESLVAAIEAERLLSRELAGYEDMWVAVRDHHVVASAATLNALLKMIGPKNDVESCFQVLSGDLSFFSADNARVARDSRYSNEFSRDRRPRAVRM